MNRVFITGMGAVSPFGVGLEKMVNAMENNRSATCNMKKQWEPFVPDLECWVGAPLQEPLDLKKIPRTYRRTMGLTSQMAYEAARESLENAQVTQDIRKSGRMGIVFGSTTGSAHAMTEFFDIYLNKHSIKKIGTGTFFKLMSHTSAANLAQAFDIHGRLFSTDSACTSSTQAIGLGFETIRSGSQDIMLCGGSDELHPLVSATFDLVYAASYKYNDAPDQTPRPFDKDRDGTVCGSGAGCLVLESESSARSRGIPCLAEILGFSTLVDPSSMAQSNSNAIVRCMNGALEDADIATRQIDCINAHATGTLQGDAAEAKGIREVFGDEAVPVNALKGYIGHTSGASGVLELSAFLATARKGILLPTRNLAQPGEDCKGLAYVTSNMSLNGLSDRFIFIKNSFGFGGINAVLILRRCE